jgi:hypothetical protein
MNAPTFTKDVAPILQKNCQSCHRPGEAAPFSMLTYKETRPWVGHQVVVANVRELRAISHSDRRSDQVDAEKLARFARLDPKIFRPNRPTAADTMQAKASAAKQFRLNGDVRSQTEPGPCRCTTSPNADVWTRFVFRERAPRRTNRRLRDGGLHAIPVTTTRSMPWILERSGLNSAGAAAETPFNDQFSKCSFIPIFRYNAATLGGTCWICRPQK